MISAREGRGRGGLGLAIQSAVNVFLIVVPKNNLFPPVYLKCFSGAFFFVFQTALSAPYYNVWVLATVTLHQTWRHKAGLHVAWSRQGVKLMAADTMEVPITGVMGQDSRADAAGY